MRSITALCILLSGLVPTSLLHSREIPLEGAWELQRGDTVVLLGDAFFEREASYGWIETQLTSLWPDRQIKYRNLAWSGDTPRCEARSYFGPPEEGFQRLKGHLELTKPTVVFSCYGASNAMEGEAGIAPFIESYKKLLDMVSATTSAAIVLVGPPPGEVEGELAPVLEARNKNLALYNEAIRQLAAERKLRFVDAFAALQPALQDDGKTTLTVMGIHFSEAGYEQIAAEFVRALGFGVPAEAKANAALRPLIQRKNELFFYRWRPQNEIYIFGGRKHEQGNNAVEIPQFDPLIEAAEKKVSEQAAAQPQP